PTARAPQGPLRDACLERLPQARGGRRGGALLPGARDGVRGAAPGARLPRAGARARGRRQRGGGQGTGQGRRRHPTREGWRRLRQTRQGQLRGPGLRAERGRPRLGPPRRDGPAVRAGALRVEERRDLARARAHAVRLPRDQGPGRPRGRQEAAEGRRRADSRQARGRGGRESDDRPRRGDPAEAAGREGLHGAGEGARPRRLRVQRRSHGPFRRRRAQSARGGGLQPDAGRRVAAGEDGRRAGAAQGGRDDPGGRAGAGGDQGPGGLRGEAREGGGPGARARQATRRGGETRRPPRGGEEGGRRHGADPAVLAREARGEAARRRHAGGAPGAARLRHGAGRDPAGLLRAQGARARAAEPRRAGGRARQGHAGGAHAEARPGVGVLGQRRAREREGRGPLHAHVATGLRSPSGPRAKVKAMSVQRTPMTRAGHEKLKEELERLKRVERPATSKAIAEARAHGDLSENAEYHAAREKLGFIEGRIAALEAKVGNAEVIEPPIGGDRVTFGSTVLLEDESGKEYRYQIVGSDETEPARGRISVLAPLARTLIGKKVGDTATAELPGGKKKFEILKANFSWSD